MFETWVSISAAIVIGCLFIALAVYQGSKRIANAIIGTWRENIVPQKIETAPFSTKNSIATTPVQTIEPPNDEMNRRLLNIKTRVFDQPVPQVTTGGDIGVEIDAEDDLSSATARLSKNLGEGG